MDRIPRRVARMRSALVGRSIAVGLLVGAWLGAGPPAEAQEPGTFGWPVVGPVTATFDPPATPFGSGHRGIDVAAGIGTPVVAPAPAVVAFAGPVGGDLFLTLDHGRGIETTYSWLSALRVRKNDVVLPGEVVAETGPGHPGRDVPQLHLGARLHGEYVDPLWLLEPLSFVDLIRLAPLAA